MTYATPEQRAALIDGLRALADYLESSPDVPAPNYTDVFTFPPDGDCPGMRAEIDAIAGLLGSPARETRRTPALHRDPLVRAGRVPRCRYLQAPPARHRREVT